MRDIKFRAKRQGDGKWVYGDLTHEVRIRVAGNEKCIRVHHYDVDENTIGQYTGLKDMDGKEIYEGDIVEIISYCTQPRDEVLTKTKADVVFRKGSFVARRASAVYCIANYLGYVQVIGNIHDNPELMKGGEK